MITKTDLALSPVEQKALSEFVGQLHEKFGRLVQSVVLFGSKARGDSKPDSDIDVLIVVDSDDWQLHKQICYLAVEIGLKYDLLELSPRIWSVSHLEKMKAIGAVFYNHIKQDGIDLLGGQSSLWIPLH